MEARSGRRGRSRRDRRQVRPAIYLCLVSITRCQTPGSARSKTVDRRHRCAACEAKKIFLICLYIDIYAWNRIIYDPRPPRAIGLWLCTRRAIRITLFCYSAVNTQPTAPKSVLTECTPLCYPCPQTQPKLPARYCNMRCIPCNLYMPCPLGLRASGVRLRARSSWSCDVRRASRVVVGHRTLRSERMSPVVQVV